MMHRVYVSFGVYAVLGRVALTPLLEWSCVIEVVIATHEEEWLAAGSTFDTPL